MGMSPSQSPEDWPLLSIVMILRASLLGKLPNFTLYSVHVK